MAAHQEKLYELTNEQRADWAAAAVAAFPLALPSPRGGLSREELIGDLVANLLHLARREKINPLRLVERAVGHFVAEEEALEVGDLGPEVDVALAIIIDDQDYHALGKQGRRLARRERARQMEREGTVSRPCRKRREILAAIKL